MHNHKLKALKMLLENYKRQIANKFMAKMKIVFSLKL